MAAKKTSARDPHDGIPKDEEGNPIFFVLPDLVREKYERRIAKCKIGWQATGDPAFISEAQTWTHAHRQPPTLWLSEAIIELAAKRRTKGYATRIYRAAIRRLRFLAVREAKEGGLTWDDAYAAASKALKGTDAAGKASTMERAYKDVARDLKKRRGGRYVQPLIPLRKLGDVLGRKPGDGS